MNGIDVSKHNGNIDWQSVKKSGKVDFVCRVRKLSACVLHCERHSRPIILLMCRSGEYDSVSGKYYVLN